MTDSQALAKAASVPGAARAGASAEAAPPRRDHFLLVCASAVGLLYMAGLLLPHGSGDAFEFHTLAHGVTGIVHQMWWGMALAVVFVGVLARMPRDLVMSALGRQEGFPSLARAVGAGVFLDLCSHGILAVGMKLYERGASIGQVMAFLLASPWNSFSLTLILFALIGVGWTLVFIALSMLIGLVTGAIFDYLVKAGSLAPNPHRQALGSGQASFASLWREFRSGWGFSWGGSWALLKDGAAGARIVIKWTLFGILLASLIRALVPAEAFADWFGPSLVGLWLTLFAATVIEVCSEGTTPIAADLMHRAQAPGNGFTFLMAGVATDYTEIMSIKETTASWRIALFLPLVTLPQIMLLGFVLNHF